MRRLSTVPTALRESIQRSTRPMDSGLSSSVTFGWTSRCIHALPEQLRPCQACHFVSITSDVPRTWPSSRNQMAKLSRLLRSGGNEEGGIPFDRMNPWRRQAIPSKVLAAGGELFKEFLICIVQMRTVSLRPLCDSSLLVWNDR